MCVAVCVQVSMGFGTDARSYMISGNWDPTDPHFELLNIETAKGQRRTFWIYVDARVLFEACFNLNHCSQSLFCLTQMFLVLYWISAPALANIWTCLQIWLCWKFWLDLQNVI